MGRTVSGYELKTLPQLANELKSLAGRSDFAWLTDPVIFAEVDAAVLTLTRAQKDNIQLDAPGMKQFGDSELRKHCISKSLSPIRSLSYPDAKALAAAAELNAALATDEWPLRFVAEYYRHDNGDPIQLLSSVDLLSLLEAEGLLTREDRRKTYADWLKDGTKLLHGSAKLYEKLFGEKPPTAQG